MARDLDDRVSGLVIIAVFGSVLIIAMASPWDPDASGRFGFPIACGVAIVAALFVGHESRGMGAPVRGALIGALAAVAFVVGTWVVYERGWDGRSWEEFGESEYGMLELTLTVVAYSLPAAGIGAALALLGRTSRRFV